MHEKKLQQELERQKEEDELKRRVKKPKQGPVKEEPPLKKSHIPTRQVATLARSLAEAEAVAVTCQSAQHISPPEHRPENVSISWWSRRWERLQFAERCWHVACCAVPRLVLSFWCPALPWGFRDMNPI